MSSSIPSQALLPRGRSYITRELFPASAQMEQTWQQRLEEVRGGRGGGETVEAACQGDESVTNSGMITAEELESRLGAQKQRLQLEADRLRQKAVEESRKHTQRELHKKHLEDMAKQVRESFIIGPAASLKIFTCILLILYLDVKQFMLDSASIILHLH